MRYNTPPHYRRQSQLQSVPSSNRPSSLCPKSNTSANLFQLPSNRQLRIFTRARHPAQDLPTPMFAQMGPIDKNQQRPFDLDVPDHGLLVEGGELLHVEVDSAGEVGRFGTKRQEILRNHVFHFLLEALGAPALLEGQMSGHDVPAREKFQQVQRVFEGVFVEELELGGDAVDQVVVLLELMVVFEALAVDADDVVELLFRVKAGHVVQKEVEAKGVLGAKGDVGELLALELEEVEPGQSTSESCKWSSSSWRF